MLVFVSQILTLQLDLNSGMPSFPPGLPQAAGATGSSGWVGDAGIPEQQASVGFTGPTGLQGRPGIIVLL